MKKEDKDSFMDKDIDETKSPVKPKPPTYDWENTNRMLGVSGYIGCKTGITPAAGPCLSACYEKNGNTFIIVLL